MIRIVAHNYVGEDTKERFLELARQLVEGTRQEAGNVSYHLNEDLSDPLHLTFIEVWRDMDAIKAHNASPHFTSIVPQLHKLTVREGEVTLFNEIL